MVSGKQGLVAEYKNIIKKHSKMNTLYKTVKCNFYRVSVKQDIKSLSLINAIDFFLCRNSGIEVSILGTFRLPKTA